MVDNIHAFLDEVKHKFQFPRSADYFWKCNFQVLDRFKIKRSRLKKNSGDTAVISIWDYRLSDV